MNNIIKITIIQTIEMKTIKTMEIIKKIIITVTVMEINRIIITITIQRLMDNKNREIIDLNTNLKTIYGDKIKLITFRKNIKNKIKE